MKTNRKYKALTVSKKGELFLREGHVWVYGEEIKNGEPVENGSVVDVVSEKGVYLGSGLYSEKSKIRVRILSSNANDDYGDSFFTRRVNYALDYRVTVMADDISACRLIFGEADGLPGVTADYYNGIVAVQILSFGMEMRKDIIYRAVKEALISRGLRFDGIFERNDVAIRELEGLSEYKGWYESEYISHPLSAVTEITENGIKYTVDIENGQKTGFFLDQKYNRLAVSKLAKGKKVLDCFTHTGSFALNAAKGGARSVTAVDVSRDAVNLARANAEKNGLCGNMDFICADVFDLLPRLCEEHADYDFIILDPPAFTKSRKTVQGAERGYKEINFRAMKLLPRGGYLATCSCSHFMESDMFLSMLSSAAKDAGVTLRLIEARRQAPDHPMLLNVRETDYLKFFLFQVI